MEVKNNQIGRIFREAFKDYKEQPSEKVWNAIEASNALQPVPETGKWISGKLIIGTVAVIIVGVVAFYLLKPGNNPEEDTVKHDTVKQEETRNPEVTTPHQMNLQEDPQTYPSDQPSARSENQENPQEIIVNDANTGVSEEKPSMTEKPGLNELPVNKIQPDEIILPVKIRESSSIDRYASDGGNSTIQNIINERPALVETMITFAPEKSICKGEYVEIYAAGGSGYIWSTGDLDDTLKVCPEITTIYRVTVTDHAGKQHYGDIKISVVNCAPLFVPNAFTPDGDGLNDVFKPVGSGVSDFSMKILTRTGYQVFESKNINSGWDGRINGEYAPTGVYFYQIFYTDERGKSHSMNGQVYIYR